MTPDPDPELTLNDANILYEITEGQAHTVLFSRTALSEIQSLNYLLDHDIFLHVMVRTADRVLVLNSCAQGNWGEELALPLSDLDQQDAVKARLLFGADGLDVVVDDGKAVQTGRWKNPDRPLAIAVPPGITLELASNSSAAKPRRADDAPTASEVRAPDPTSWLVSVARRATVAEIGISDTPQADLAYAAIQSGATQVTIIDSTPLHHARWQALEAALVQRGLTAQHRRFKVADLNDSYFAEQTGTFDAVFCHTFLQTQLNPLGALLNLRRITRKHCNVSAAVVPPSLEEAGRTLDLTDAGVLFAPAMSERASNMVAAYFATRHRRTSTAPAAAPGAWLSEGEPHPDRDWWVMTAEGLEKLALVAGFAIVSRHADVTAGLCSLALKPA
jgi:hypothetical protein